MTILVETNQPSLVKMVLTFCQALGVLSFKSADDSVKYNPALLEAIEKDKSGNHEDYLRFKSEDEMYRHFGMEKPAA